jgi:Rrf2 family protein
MSQLRKAGIVVSIRGAQGGYQLARPPEEITIAEVIEILEGPIVPVDCLASDDGCSRSTICATQGLWKRLADAMQEVLGSTTLADLVEENQRIRRQSQDGYMYYI